MIVLVLWWGFGCARSPQAIAIRDPRITDVQRTWLVDAEDEVAIAHARVDDAVRAETAQRDQHRALLTRIRAAGLDASPWQALGRARASVVECEHRRAVARVEHAEARLRLVRAEVGIAADLTVIDLEPLRADVERRREKLAQRVREVEQAVAEAEDQADVAWASWAESGTGAGAFWLDPMPAPQVMPPPPTPTTAPDGGDAVSDSEEEP